MPTLTTGAIKKMKLPELLSEHGEQIGGYGSENWSHSYRIPGQRYPEITFRYSGFPLFGSSLDAFRSVLAAGPQIVFDVNNDQYNGVESKKIVQSISPALGNSGDNQICNEEIGLDGPMFQLEEMEVLEIQKKPVLRVSGWFHNPEMEPKVYLNCIFIDADPKSDECRVEELYLQAFPQDLYRKHLPDFDQVLSSITWV